jgi:hypothetical protein
MKKRNLFLLCLLFNALAFSGIAQCDNEDFLDLCSSQLNDFTFVKSFESSKKTEFSYVFSKDHNYMLTVCDQGKGNKGKMAVNLYDRNHKLIMSSYNRTAKKYYPAISYNCSATGVYYIETEFSDDNCCGVSILGYKK